MPTSHNTSASIGSDDDPLRGLRQAYADTFPELDPTDRCLNFLMTDWVGYKHAIRAAHLIGPYGRFDPDDLAHAFRQIGHQSLSAFMFGREMKPVLYIETNSPDWVMAMLDDAAYPSELDELDFSTDLTAIGLNVPDGADPHSTCRHSDPPLPLDAYATRRNKDAHYIRAWWDA